MAFRRMRDPAFRASQHAHKYDSHIAPLNHLIDELARAGRGAVPHIAPMYGGVHARVLAILRDPGPATQAETGSGMLCVENDDPTAERYGVLLQEAGLPVSELVPWNAYPWYINRKPTLPELDAGVDALRRLIVLMPRPARRATPWR